MLRRHQTVGCHYIKAAVNPIEPADLINLAAWNNDGPFVKESDSNWIPLPLTDLARADLPDGLGFDKSRRQLMLR